MIILDESDAQTEKILKHNFSETKRKLEELKGKNILDTNIKL